MPERDCRGENISALGSSLETSRHLLNGSESGKNDSSASGKRACHFRLICGREASQRSRTICTEGTSLTSEIHLLRTNELGLDDTSDQSERACEGEYIRPGRVSSVIAEASVDKERVWPARYIRS